MLLTILSRQSLQHQANLRATCQFHCLGSLLVQLRSPFYPGVYVAQLSRTTFSKKDSILYMEEFIYSLALQMLTLCLKAIWQRKYYNSWSAGEQSYIISVSALLAFSFNQENP